MVERLIVVAPRGFCAGVVRAVELVELALARLGAPVYVRRAIVHNPHVVRRLEQMGAVFVQEVEDVPAGAPVIVSAHGVAPVVRHAAAARGLALIDATCPLVAKVHQEVLRFVAGGYDVILVGHAGHDEVIGTLGQVPGRVHLVQRPEDVAGVVVRDPGRVACVTQTTLSPDDVAPVVDALRARFPALAQPRVDDICFATKNRQAAVRWLARQVDVVLVLGDPTSSNSVRLREVATAEGTPAYLLGRIDELQSSWLEGATAAGLTAGASTPEALVQEAVEYFRARGATVHEEVLETERLQFSLPPIP
jgi:4-hydroxy-3-methylbut-2-enyl diphosphate reductase